MTGQSPPVVVVTHEGPSNRLRKCLDALDASGDGDLVVVVDNSGREGSADEHFSEHATIEVVVVRTENRGYGAAANVGFAEAARRRTESDAVALLNDDIVVASGWLSELCEALREGWAAVQPKLLFAEPGDQHGRTVNSVGVQTDRYGAGSDIGHGEADGPKFDGTTEIDIFTGGAVLFTRAFLELTGGFDERYFLYYEDVDLALRGRELGQQYACVATSVVWHEGGASTEALGDARRQLQERNRLWCVLRHAPPSTIARALGLSVRRLRHAPRRAHLDALAGGLVKAPQQLIERRRADRRPVNSTSP